MRVIRSTSEMRNWSLRERALGRSIGLVPTMGALHQGHAGLIRRARKECDRVVVTLFVNPAQFAANEDFGRYPRPFESDRVLCAALGADVLFAPSASEMYPPASQTFVVQERLANVLCGASRPMHFRGVLTVVLKLFNLVLPHAAYFGRKDYQQTVVIRRMVADLDVAVRVIVCPTVREQDGLAMSSRNRQLSAVERKAATCLVRALRACRAEFRAGERRAARLRRGMRSLIRREPLARIDYVEIVRPETLEPARDVRRGDVALVAVFVGNTRLIDNVVLR